MSTIKSNIIDDQQSPDIFDQTICEVNMTLESLDLNVKAFKHSMSLIPNLKEVFFEEKGYISEKTLCSVIDELNKILNQRQEVSENIDILETLGAGSFGEVSIAYDKKMRVFMAKKKMKKMNNFFNYCLIEIQVLIEIIRLNNPDLLSIYKIEFDPDQTLEIYMERGMGTLEDLSIFMKENSYRCDECLDHLKSDLLYQVETLAVNKISHFDIKPTNIIISKDFRFKLADYGTALVLDNPKKECEITTRGTPLFMSKKMKQAVKDNKDSCTLIPFEADLESLDLSVEEITKINSQGVNLISFKDLKESFNHEMIYKIYSRSNPSTQETIRNLMFENKILQELEIKLKKELQKIQAANLPTSELEFVLLEGLTKIRLENYDYIGAKESTSKTIKCAEVLWGTDPPQLEDLCERMGRVSTYSFNLKDADFYLKMGLRIKEKVHGKGSINFIRHQFSYGNLQMFKNEYLDAIKTFNEALELMYEITKDNHMTTAAISISLGRCYCFVREFDKVFFHLNNAEKMLLALDKETEIEMGLLRMYSGHAYMAKDGYEENLHDFHHETIPEKTLDLKNALESYSKCVSVRTKYYGEEDNLGISTYALIGDVKRVEKKYDEALSYLDKCYNSQVKLLGKDNHATIFVLSKYSILYNRLKNYDKAIEVCLQGILIHKSVQGEQPHPEVGFFYDSLATAYRGKNDLQNSLESCKKSLQIRKALGNIDDILASYENLGWIYFCLQNYWKALKKFFRCIKIRKQIKMGEDEYPKTIMLAKLCIREISQEKKEKIDVNVALKYLLLTQIIFNKTEI